MLNSINLHDSTDYYEVTHQGKHYKCARVSNVIEQTSATPTYLKMWMVNCAVETILGGYHINFPHEPSKENLARAKKIAWSAHQIKSQQALDVGTKVHGMIKKGAFDESIGDEESRACWKAYQAFAAKFIPVPIAQEIALYDLKNLFAGTCDWIGTLRARKAISAKKKGNSQSSQYPKHTIYILDWKTSKAINSHYKIQICVYKHMIKCLIKEFLKYPSRFDHSTSKILNDIILVAGKNPQIVCGIVRLPKRLSTRTPFEFYELTAKEEKAYLKEFSLMAKLHNHREKEKNNGNLDGK